MQHYKKKITLFYIMSLDKFIFVPKINYMSALLLCLFINSYFIIDIITIFTCILIYKIIHLIRVWSANLIPLLQLCTQIYIG